MEETVAAGANSRTQHVHESETAWTCWPTFVCPVQFEKTMATSDRIAIRTVCLARVAGESLFRMVLIRPNQQPPSLRTRQAKPETCHLQILDIRQLHNITQHSTRSRRFHEPPNRRCLNTKTSPESCGDTRYQRRSPIKWGTTGTSLCSDKSLLSHRNLRSRNESTARTALRHLSKRTPVHQNILMELYS